MNALQVLDRTTDYVSKHFEKYDSRYKRNKILTSHPLYVPPLEVGIGTRFELERDRVNNIAIPKRIQSTFEYVSIVDTLVSLFKSFTSDTIH